MTDAATAESVFTRVVAGVDGSEPGFEACRQALRLVAPGGRLELLTAVQLAQAALAGFSATQMAEELRHEAEEALRRAVEIAGDRAEAHLLNGPPAAVLLHELAETRATLAAVGTHGHSRAAEIMIGGVAGELLHSAPCSVLIARPPATEALFPHAIVSGVDGSPEAAEALATGEYLAGRFGAELRVVVATSGKGVDVSTVRERTPGVEAVAEHPVDALVTVSRRADLLVVGSRGLHGLRALGSVSERVAHEAACSVLVVRRQPS